MATLWLDSNGATPGFGLLDQAVTLTSNLICSTNDQGTSVSTQTFSAANAHVLNIGSLATSANTSPGTVTIGANTRSISVNGLTFQNMPTSGNQTITNSTFPSGFLSFVGTNAYCEVTATGKLIFNSLVSGSVNWQKRGASTLQLLKANDFSGGMTISAGTVEIANASALGTGTVTMTGGKLSSSSAIGYTLANAFSLNGTVILCDATNNGLLTLSGALTIAGTTSLSIPANYVLVQGVFGGTGSFNLTSGEIDLEGNVGTKSGGTTISGGTLYLGFGKPASNQLGSDAITLTSGNVFFCGSTDTSPTNAITGSGGFLYARPRNATITFSGAGAYAGVARIFASAADGAGTTTQGMTFSSASFPAVSDFTFINQNSAAASNTQTIKYTGSATSITSTASISIAPTAATTSVWHHAPSNGSGTMSLSGAVASNTTVAHTFRVTNDSSGLLSFTNGIDQRNTGVLTLVKTGTGPATVSGTGTYLGSVSVSQGTFNANSATALGLATSTTGISVTSGATLSLGAAATYTLRTLSIAGNGSASAPNNGALIINHLLTSTFGGITLTGPTYIRATNDGLLDASFTPGGYSLILGAAAGVTFTPFANIAKVFSGIGSVIYGSQSADSGTVKADVRHTYTGNTTLSYGTTAIASSQELPGTGGPLGNKSLTAANTLLMDGGTLSYLDGNVDYSGRFSTAGGQQWRIAAGTATTFATALVGASSLRLFGGSLTLSSAASTFSGGVTLTEGTLYAGAAQNGVSGPLGITGTITFSPAGTGVLAYTAASATFDYSSRFATTNGQSRRINVNGESVTFSTALGGTNAFALVGSTGILTLAVANTYTQGTTLSVGTLKCGNAASLGTGGLAQANGTTLHVATSNGKLTIQGAHTNTGNGPRTIRIGA
jgi:autotransporter-associated beta strand protein